jgi:predicted transcriptional regulator
MLTKKEETKIINKNKHNEKIINILTLKDKKYKQTDVAKLLNIGLKTVQKYWHENIKDYKL